jgi:Ankyrin repeats (3 copies)
LVTKRIGGVVGKKAEMEESWETLRQCDRVNPGHSNSIGGDIVSPDASEVKIAPRVADPVVVMQANEQNGVSDNGLGLHLIKLMKSCRNLDIAECKAFIDNGADLDVEDDDGNTVLHVAVKHCDTNVIKLLLDQGVPVDSENNLGYTPLRVAVNCNRKKVIALLLYRNTDIDAPDNRGNTPLHVAASKGIINLLLVKGAEVNAVDDYGETPLHDALSKNEVYKVRLLLSHRNINIHAKKGSCSNETPLEIARSSKCQKISNVFSEYLLRIDKDNK